MQHSRDTLHRPDRRGVVFGRLQARNNCLDRPGEVLVRAWPVLTPAQSLTGRCCAEEARGQVAPLVLKTAGNRDEFDWIGFRWHWDLPFRMSLPCPRDAPIRCSAPVRLQRMMTPALGQARKPALWCANDQALVVDREDDLCSNPCSSWGETGRYGAGRRGSTRAEQSRAERASRRFVNRRSRVRIPSSAPFFALGSARVGRVSAASVPSPVPNDAIAVRRCAARLGLTPAPGRASWE